MLPWDKIIIVYLLIMNVVTFFMYGIDKWKARKNKWRISEATLLVTALIGGSAGALLGMHIFRHKTKHWKFKILVPLFLIVHIALPVYFVLAR